MQLNEHAWKRQFISDYMKSAIAEDNAACRSDDLRRQAASNADELYPEYVAEFEPGQLQEVIESLRDVERLLGELPARQQYKDASDALARAVYHLNLPNA